MIKKIAYARYYKNNTQPIDNHILTNYTKIGISIPRETLKSTIHTRTKTMMQTGLYEEVQHIVTTYGMQASILATIGYKEFFTGMPVGNDPLMYVSSLTDAQKAAIVKSIVMDTFHYTKRQMTWLKKDLEIQWFENKDDLSNKVIFEVIKKNV